MRYLITFGVIFVIVKLFHSFQSDFILGKDTLSHSYERNINLIRILCNILNDDVNGPGHEYWNGNGPRRAAERKTTNGPCEERAGPWNLGLCRALIHIQWCYSSPFSLLVQPPAPSQPPRPTCVRLFPPRLPPLEKREIKPSPIPFRTHQRTARWRMCEFNELSIF